MPTLLELSERLWTGRDSIHDPAHHPFTTLNQIDELAPGVAFYKNFSNIGVLGTADGLVLLDTGSFHPLAHRRSFDGVRSWSDLRIHTAVYTHGHVDHAYGLPPFLAEAAERGWARPRVVAHRDVVPRMERYIETAGFNAVINQRQFQQAVEWPTRPIYPTDLYHERLDLEVGGVQLELHHARGETDDHTWVWASELGVLYTGDLFIWSAPNAGNPQKVQRYCADWARALREMAALRPRFLLPGHGLPIAGEARVRQALLETASYLESIYSQTLDLMNQGASIDELIHTVKPPAALADRPFLQPIYDEPEFIVRNIYRCLGGWYSGTPSELKPSPLATQGRAIADLAGGFERLLRRAEECQAAGDFRLASHLVDWAAAAEPDSVEVHRVRAQLYTARAGHEPSTMSRGVFAAAARDSERRLRDCERRLAASEAGEEPAPGDEG